MSTRHWGVNWLNENALRAYPLAAEASARDRTGSFRVPTGMLLALYLPVAAGGQVRPERFYLKRLVVTGTGVSVGVAYDDGSADPPLAAAAAVPLDLHAEYQGYALGGVGEFADTVGRVVLGKPEELRALPAGQYTFDPDAGRLDPDCVRPQLRGVTSLVLVNGAERSESLYGDLELEAGTNVAYTVRVEGGVTVIRVDAVSGEGLNEDCGCVEEAPCVKTLNGVGPDAEGNIDLLGDECMEVTAAANALVLNDICSNPCCGCEELAAVTRDLELFGEARTTLTNFLNRLEAQVTQMNLVVLGSRLNDRGCYENCDG